MDHVLVERRVIYRWRRNPEKGRWNYVESFVTLTPDVSDDPGLHARLRMHLSDEAEILFIGPPREIWEGVRWGSTYNVKKGAVSHLIGPRGGI